MSASSAASSTLTRSKAAVLVFTSLAAAYLIYYHQRHLLVDRESSAPTSRSTGLYRSNAVHRRRPRALTNEESDREAPQEREYELAAAEDADNTPGLLGDGETVVDEQGPSEFGGWSAGEPRPPQRNGQNIVQLLFRVSEDATRRNAYVHRGCQCNSCGTVPIRGIRYRCSNCADFDLCEACEAQGQHLKTHIFYKVRVPTSSFSTRQMQPVWYPGEPDTCLKTLPRELITKLSKETGFDRPELDAYWEQWTFMANSEWREDPDELCLAMDRKTFDQCFVPSGGNRHATPNLIHDRMFAFYDTNHDDLISFPEFLNGLAYRKRKDKLKKVFDGYDINGDGYVDRRDFLRILRSYYVLYKQMHRDLLEGLDDQVMNSSESHQLVTSRQPLSSAFGRDGRFPPAPDPRSGEGKAPGVTGDLEIIDGRGVINESGNDQGNREEVIVDAVVREYPRWQQQAPSWGVTGGNTYWRALADPPETIDALQHDVIEGLIRDRRRVLQDGTPVGHYQNSLTDTGSVVDDHDDDEDDDDGDDNDEEDADGEGAQEKWPPEFITIADVEAVCGGGISVAETPRWQRKEVISAALHRLREDAEDRDTRAVKEELHERWKRRQFYTDEEEGAVAPPDWKEEDDISYPITKAVEFKDSVPPSRPISPRSRSSSKVRFAEDTDDYEIRSNPSTSSRSIPERWGGMEIPDAEKDAGKEILYQVTQQAYNELLDQLFKKQEDIAVKALSNKKARNKHHHLFTNPLFEEWALLLDKDLRKSKKKRLNVVIEPKQGEKEPVVIPDVELPEIRQRPLEDLLATTGYAVDAGAGADRHTIPSTNRPSEVRVAIVSNISNENRDSAHSSPGVSAGSWVNITDSAASERARDSLELARGSDNLSTQLLVADGAAHENTSISTRFNEPDDRRAPNQGTSRLYRDPTLPQFRPNFISLDSPRRDAMFTTIESSGSALPNALQIFEDQDRSGMVDAPARDLSPIMINGNTAESTGAAPASSGRPLSAHKAEVLKIFNSCPKGQARPPSPVEFEKSHIKAAKERAMSLMTEEHRKEFENVDWKMLYNLREMEGWEKQATIRGGWGRLSYEEFEQVVKGEDVVPMSEQARRAMMSYLGSWIDICIP